jgi:predicted N-acetyltransferase YhbS
MSVVVRPLRAADLPAAQDIHRLAFARFFGVDPATFRPGNRTLATRATTHPDGGLVAEEDGRLVGSAVIMAWGRIAVVGPITVHPDRWSGGIGRALMAASPSAISAPARRRARARFTSSSPPRGRATRRASPRCSRRSRRRRSRSARRAWRWA